MPLREHVFRGEGMPMIGQRKVRYRPMQCRSLLNRVPGEEMPFRWSINPYRGCVHACPWY